MTVEKRRHPRIKVNAIIDYLAMREFRVCEMKDLSASGVFALTREPIPPGEIIHLDFYLPGIEYKFKLKGRVVRIVTEEEAAKDGFSPGMGIEFVDPPRDMRQDIENFVSEALKEDLRG